MFEEWGEGDDTLKWRNGRRFYNVLNYTLRITSSRRKEVILPLKCSGHQKRRKPLVTQNHGHVHPRVINVQLL